MSLRAYYRCILKDRNGKIVKRTHWRESRSFVLQFLQIIQSTIFHEQGVIPPNVTNVRDTGNVLRTSWGGSDAGQRMGIATPVNVDTYGIVVGNGTTPPTNSDYALASKIAHGSGSGQLLYGSTTQVGASVVGSNVDYVITRTFLNNSGASIIVREIGMYCSQYDGAGYRYFCLIRDLLPSPITVDNTLTLTVQYTLRTTV